VVERAVLLAPETLIDPEHLGLEAPPVVHVSGVLSACDPAVDTFPLDGASPTEPSERTRITEALEACAGNQSRAANLLGMSRRTLVRRISLLRLPRPRRPHA
jgi:two-component system response regulator AtoC